MKEREQTNSSGWKKKKNMKRLGGGGLSLEIFANAKSMNNNYSPALIKKKKEFYRNAKYLKSYKKALKRERQPSGLSSAVRAPEDEKEKGDAGHMNDSQKRRKKKKNSGYSLKELYEEKREEEEKVRMESEAIARNRKEERKRSELRRKASREKMFKKTQRGQPVMKYRIEHLLENIKGFSDDKA